MSKLIINIVTAAVTMIIGIFTGRAMKIGEYERKVAISEYQYRYMRDEYMRNLRKNQIKSMVIPKRRDSVNKQPGIKTIKDKQLEIINHYGTDKQLEQLLEESGELIVAIAKNKRYEQSESSLGYRGNLIEEMADVKNLIEQIELKDPYVKESIEVTIKHKVERELGRIKGSAK